MPLDVVDRAVVQRRGLRILEDGESGNALLARVVCELLSSICVPRLVCVCVFALCLDFPLEFKFEVITLSIGGP